MERTLKIGNKQYHLHQKPLIMGIINRTPDSFYDGGKYCSLSNAVQRAHQLIDAGCDILDIGGESTRPGSQKVEYKIEIERVIPVIKEIKKHFPDQPVSLDTYKKEVLTEGIHAGIDMINDVYALSGSEGMLSLAIESKLPVVFMHMQNNPTTMQDSPEYTDIIKEVKLFFKKKVDIFIEQGGMLSNCIIDPGIGFGKTLQHNLALLRNLNEIRIDNLPILVGLSRKSMFEHLLHLDTEDRLVSSVVMGILSHLNGADILRVHDVKETQDALQLLHSFKNNEYEKLCLAKC